MCPISYSGSKCASLCAVDCTSALMLCPFITRCAQADLFCSCETILMTILMQVCLYRIPKCVRFQFCLSFTWVFIQIPAFCAQSAATLTSRSFISLRMLVVDEKLLLLPNNAHILCL